MSHVITYNHNHYHNQPFIFTEWRLLLPQPFDITIIKLKNFPSHVRALEVVPTHKIILFICLRLPFSSLTIIRNLVVEAVSFTFLVF